jgi:ferritin-like metal-binding protein YciE
MVGFARFTTNASAATRVGYTRSQTTNLGDFTMDGDANGNYVHEHYHTGLRNMHALEMTAIELTQRQLERLEHYPEMRAKLQDHHRESELQAQRLEAILERHSTSTSGVKNTVMSTMGNVAAMLHAPASDEILKNTFANFAFEHQEIAAYTSLIAMAERLGDTASVPLLTQSLNEEQAMADWIKQQLVPTTQRFMDLSSSGVRAGA